MSLPLNPIPIGSRIEIPWAPCGARFGTVTCLRHGRNGQASHYLVKFDHAPRGPRLKLFRHDWGAVRILPPLEPSKEPSK